MNQTEDQAEGIIPRQSRVTERQRVYIAGVVDALGVLRLRDVRGTRLPVVAVHCSNLGLLDWLAERTGSSVTLTRRDYVRDGCSLHCPQAHVHIQSYSGRWSVTGARATVLLYGILPYMHLQAALATEMLTAGLAAPHKPATLLKITALGWPTPPVTMSTAVRHGA